MALPFVPLSPYDRLAFERKGCHFELPSVSSVGARRAEENDVIPREIYWRLLFWPQFAGVLFLIIALIPVRRQLFFNHGDLAALGRVFVPVSLAVFGAEHLVSANFMAQMVPPWMPGRLFWAYFVGFALFAAAISIVSMKHVRLSATLLGILFLMFVLSLHLPNVMRNPEDRFAWAVALRDLVFAAGAWALAGTPLEGPVQAAPRVVATCRVVFALVLLFFGIEHVLHPEFAPGVPLEQPTPAWIPARPVWGYLIGAILLMSSVSMLMNRRARAAGTWLGVAITLVVAFIYLPMFVVAAQPSEMNTAVNYIADTLLFAGSIFLLAAAIPAGASIPDLVQQRA
jgi:uncharacterized membrane protein